MKPKHSGKSWVLLTCLVLFTLPCFADTFVVTSNADTGPGTLREAITLANANGTSVTDYIHFNIADITTIGRRIILLSVLPPLTSNLIIDASSQPGIKFGVSDAKIELYVSYTASTSQKFINIINCNNVAVYGLKINNQITWSSFEPNYCISIQNSTNVEIGNIGKGNLIVNWDHAIYAFCEPGSINKNINIYSNILGLNEDGFTPEYNSNLIVFVRIENLNVGGLDPQQGNIMACARKRIEISGTRGLILVAHNKIGTDYSGTIALSLAYGEASRLYDNIRIGDSPYASDIEYLTNVKVINNLSAGICRSGVYLLGFGNKFYIQGNKFGTDITGTKRLSQFMDYGVRIENCRSGIVGMENNEQLEKNIIAFSQTGSSSEPYLTGTGVAVINCSRGITISRNSIFCNQKWGIGISNAYPTPVVTVNNITSNSIRGTAPPNSKIEFFRDDSCTNCEGKVYFDETMADATGNWVMNGLNTENIVVTATDTSKMTSEFSAGRFSRNNLQIKHATCGRNNGQITGVSIISGTRWQWEDQNGNVISHDTTLKNVPPGFYRLAIGIGNNSCDIRTEFFEVRRLDVPSLVQAPIITAANCGRATGSIQLVDNITEFKSTWLNSLGDSVGTGTLLNQLLPGTYFLKLSIPSDTSCNKTYGPFNITNQSGPALNLTNLQITDATCGNNNGSITGISSGGNITGTPYIAWVDSLNRVIANTYDINNLKEGKYRFKFKDQGGCDTIITPFYSIKNNGSIILDTSQLKITASQCNASGTIKGITVTNATTYQWVNAAGQTVSTTLDPGFLFSGKYVLIARNNFGCEKRTDSISVPLFPYMTFTYVLRAEVRPGRCGQANGYARFLNFANPQDYTFRWVDSMQPSVTIANTLDLSNINYGTFILFAKNSSGCEQQVARVRIDYSPPLQLDETIINVTNEVCNNSSGRIEGLKVATGQGVAPFSYSWLDNNNNPVSAQQNLTGMSAGLYRLVVKDAVGCSDTSRIIEIKNTSATLAKPQYQDQVIRKNTSATLTVQNQQQGTYYLYDDAQTTTAIDQNTTGVFNTGILQSDKYYYIEIINGSCKSERIQVMIKVYDKAIVYIPTAFTPNKDGLNDFIVPTVFGPLKLEFFNIYNRWGQLVFSSTDISKGWDGTFKGEPQPASSFSWILKAKNELTGEYTTVKGSFILIR